MRRAIVVLPVLAAIALLGLSGAALAEDRVVEVKVRADSEHPGLEAFRAMDGNPATIWHAIWWSGVATRLPHEIVVDLGKSYEITGFTHLTRPAACKNGNIKDYEVYLSDKPEAKKPLAKGTPVAKGTFENEVGESVVKFDAPVKGRYFRLRALSNINGQPTWSGIGELTLHCEGVKFVGKPWPKETAEDPKGPGSKLTGPKAATAKVLWIIKDGVLDKKALAPGSTDNNYCSGKTVDGFHVTGRETLSRLRTAKSAVGDFEFKAVFSATAGGSKWRFPNITISDRGQICFWKTGSPMILNSSRAAMPLEGFSVPLDKSAFDGNLHAMAVTRRGGKISFYYDDKQVNEQSIDPDVRLHVWFDALFTPCKIKSIKLTAEKFSDNLKTDFKSAAPIQEILVGEGSGKFKKAVYGRAASYRIPALAVSKKGTILAFAEARRLDKNDIGDHDAVVKRSEDGGKTWGPEIVILDNGNLSVNNPCPIVDMKTGRIWFSCARWKERMVLYYSDDDGKTWSKERDITEMIRKSLRPGITMAGPSAGAGIMTERGKTAGRLIMPLCATTPSTMTTGVLYSDDRGETWKLGGMLMDCPSLANARCMVEALCAEMTDGSILFNGRVLRPNRGQTIIADFGLKDTKEMWLVKDLPEANCQGSIIRHSWPKDGKPGIILYSGPGLATGRVRGTLFASYDDGKTWPWKQVYYQGGSGYSDIAVLPDGRVAVLFEKDGKIKLGFMIVPAPPAAPPAE